MHILIPTEICNSLHFNFNYPRIEITPWNETIKTNVKKLCGLLAMYSNHEVWKQSLSEHEQEIFEKKTPYKRLDLDPHNMKELLSILDGIASNAFAPEGQLLYLSNSQGRYHFDRDELLIKNFVKDVDNEVNYDFKEQLEKQTFVINTPKINTSPTSKCSSISMQILGGFMAVTGVATVALAFVILNAATFGLAGLIAAGVGTAGILGGVGLFAVGASRSCPSTIDEPLNNPFTPV